MRLGSRYVEEGRCEFVVWSPASESVSVKIVSPEERLEAMTQIGDGYWRADLSGVCPGARYFYRLNGEIDRPDPASQSQPLGVHGPSEVVDPDIHAWSDVTWSGAPLEELVIYELHVGTFTREGTFAGIIGRLDDLIDLGVTAIELMPVAQFPGDRNWGYDGVYPFAVQSSYGGPAGLKSLVDACHQKGISVILDVVYNHLGPEGNYLSDFGPYFTGKYRTPWGDAINFDGAESDGVKNFFLENVLFWMREYHLDGLRIDAIHAIFDQSANPLPAEISAAVEIASAESGRNFLLIAESNLNDVRLIRPRALGGYGLDAQWNDDFHHSLRTLLTGETKGYYQDFGRVEQLAAAYREGFVYSGQYSPYHRRRHGSSSKDRPANQFVVFSQNHDQIGNRLFGERLSMLAPAAALRLAAAAVLLSPFIPMLFMGEEYGETAPFLYFVSHGDPDLVEAVRRGRKAEFDSFGWTVEPPDPQAIETFEKSILDWSLRDQGSHRRLLDYYRRLIQLRREIPALKKTDKKNQAVESNLNDPNDRLVMIRRWCEDSHVLILLNFNRKTFAWRAALPAQNWIKLLDSNSDRWAGSGSVLPETMVKGESYILEPLSVLVYQASTS